MPIQFMVVLIWAVALLGSVLMGAVMLMYLYRGWRQLRSEGEDTVYERLLDQIDQIQMQLYSMSERLESMERRLPPPEDGSELRNPTEAPSGGEEAG